MSRSTNSAKLSNVLVKPAMTYLSSWKGDGDSVVVTK